MKSLDELMADKIYELVNYMLAKKIKPDISLDKETSLTEADIEKLKSQLKVIVVSNGIDRGVEDFFKLQGIDYIGFAHKTLKKNFIKACDKIGISTEKVLVIEDSLWCDIFGGQRNKMKTALVKKVEDEPSL